MFILGLSDENGSWNTTWISFLKSKISFLLKLFKFLSLITISPLDLIKLRIAKINEVFPEPDSPTIPIVSPTFKL